MRDYEREGVVTAMWCRCPETSKGRSTGTRSERRVTGSGYEWTKYPPSVFYDAPRGRSDNVLGLVVVVIINDSH